MCDFFLGIDLGTSVCKCALYNQNLQVISESAVKCSLNKLSAAIIEQDPEEWWDSTCRAVTGALGKAGIDGRLVKALAISSQGISFVPVDEGGKPLRPAISWLDSRAAAEKDMIESVYGVQKLFSMTGKRSSESYTLPKLLWLQNHEPDILYKTCKVLTAHDFIAYRLCGRFFTDHTLASGTMAYNINQRDWDSEILHQFHLDRRLFPDILQSGTAAGRITSKAVKRLGINSQAVIVTGGQDQKCAALGAGIGAGLGREEAAVSLGTATAVIKIGREAVIDPSMAIACFAGLGAGEWVLEGALATSCASLNWLKDTILAGTNDNKLDKMVAETYSKPNDVFFYPFLTPVSKGDGKSVPGSFLGISLSTGLADLVRSVYEGIAFQIHSLVSDIEEISGSMDGLRLYGGGARSDIWCQMIADITGRKIMRMKDSETACRGAAMLAGIGSGAWPDLSGAGETLAGDSFLPNEKMKRQYHDLYDKYIDLQKNLSA